MKFKEMKWFKRNPFEIWSYNSSILTIMNYDSCRKCQIKWISSFYKTLLSTVLIIPWTDYMECLHTCTHTSNFDPNLFGFFLMEYLIQSISLPLPLYTHEFKSELKMRGSSKSLKYCSERNFEIQKIEHWTNFLELKVCIWHKKIQFKNYSSIHSN